MQSLRGKVALITGASSGIGAGIAQYFAKQGVRLSLAGRKPDNLNNIAASTQLPESDLLTTIGDIQKDEDRRQLIDRSVEKFGQLDILINNAGTAELSPLSDVTEEHYENVFTLNLKAHIFLTKLTIPHLIQTKGNIINMSSIASYTLPPLWGVYSMTKVALNVYTMVLASELGPKGVRVNAICSGVVPTEIWKRGNLADYEEYMKELDIVSMTPLRRMGTTEELAHASAFLASDLASFVTGELLFADGGLRLR